MNKFTRTSLLGITLFCMSTGVQAQDDVDCNGCVDKKDLAASSVTGFKILDGSIKNKDLANNSINGNKIIDGSIKVRDVSSKLKVDIDTTCPLGTHVVGKDKQGRFICEPGSIMQGGFDLSSAAIDSEVAADHFLEAGDGNTAHEFVGGESVLVIASGQVYKDPDDTSGVDDIVGTFNACYRDVSDPSAVVVPCYTNGDCYAGVTPFCFSSTGENDQKSVQTSFLFRDMPAGTYEFGICPAKGNLGGCSADPQADFMVSGRKISVIESYAKPLPAEE